MPAEALMTAEELLVLDLPGKSTELVRGRLIVREPPSTCHGRIAARLVVVLGQHVYRKNLGEVFRAGHGIQDRREP